MALQSGGNIPIAQDHSVAPDNSGDHKQLECNGEKLDILLRLGLLKLASGVEWPNEGDSARNSRTKCS